VFKLQAVSIITDQTLSGAEAARRPDVGENPPRTWRKAFEARGDAAFPGRGNPTPADDVLRRLRAERDLLTKAAACFASPPG
jgi:transposase-like protein